MISCLENLIGLEDVTESPTSGRYLNELQGIDTNQFDEIRKTETYDIDAAWQNIERRAIRKFEQHLLRWADNYFRNINVIDTQVTGQVDNNVVTTTGGNHYAGWLFKEFWSYSKNTLLNINWIQLYATANVSQGSIYVFNAATGDTVDTILYDATANTVTQIAINKQYPFWKYPQLFIAYDDSEVTPYRINQLPFGPYYFQNLVQGRFAKTSTILGDQILSLDTNGQGMVLNYNVSCGLDNFVCQRLANFEEPYMYLLGVEFCNERIYSHRINQYTLLDRERAIELRTEFQANVDEWIQGQLSSMTMDSSYDDYCFNCNRTYNYVPNMP